MSYLENFSEDQKQLLIALPYRAGLWVSESDSSGGDHADEAEMMALEGIITGFAQDFCKSEFVEEVMGHTLDKRAQWEEWSKNLDRAA